MSGLQNAATVVLAVVGSSAILLRYFAAKKEPDVSALLCPGAD
jgi:hypothetical protein